MMRRPCRRGNQKPSPAGEGGAKRRMRSLTLRDATMMRKRSFGRQGPHPSLMINASIFHQIPQGPVDPFSLKTLHWRVFQALKPFPKGEGKDDEKATKSLPRRPDCPSHTHAVRASPAGIPRPPGPSTPSRPSPAWHSCEGCFAWGWTPSRG